jgi:DNA (cytosine-5)-methyltransferase 1
LVLADASNTLNNFDLGDTRTTHAVVQPVAWTQNQREEVRLLGDKVGAIALPGTHQTNYIAQPVAIQGTIIGRGETSGPQGTGATEGGPMFTLTKTDIHGVCHQQVYENSRRDALRIYDGAVPTLQSFMGTGGCNVPMVQHHMPGSVAPTVTSSGPPYSRTGNERVEAEALAITFQPGNLRREAGADPSTTTTTTLKASAGDQMPHIATAMAVRRLTPVECERLQGFPDNWSQIPWKGKPADQCPDGPRYKCAGNSMAVPVMRWIGEQIARVEAETK